MHYVLVIYKKMLQFILKLKKNSKIYFLMFLNVFHNYLKKKNKLISNYSTNKNL